MMPSWEEVRARDNERREARAPRKVGRWWRIREWFQLRRTVGVLERELAETRAKARSALELALGTGDELRKYRGSFTRLAERVHELECQETRAATAVRSDLEDEAHALDELLEDRKSWPTCSCGGAIRPLEYSAGLRVCDECLQRAAGAVLGGGRAS